MTDSEPPRSGDLTAEQWSQRAKAIEADLGEYPDEYIDILCDAAEAWYQAGELAEAERCHRQAAETEQDPGEAHVWYTTFLLTERDASRGYEMLEKLRNGISSSPHLQEFLGEALETIGDHQEALNWYNRGITRCYPDMPSRPDPDHVARDLGMLRLLQARRRVRNALEQPEDSLDETAAAATGSFRELTDSIGEDLDAEFSGQGEERLASPVVLYWPGEEFEELLRQYPGLYPDADPDEPRTEHRRAVEREAREAAQGTTPFVSQASVVDFADFCRTNELGPMWGNTLDEYARELLRRGQGPGWPPGRNEPCWCSSGRKYKKCCGAPGFVEISRSTA